MDKKYMDAIVHTNSKHNPESPFAARLSGLLNIVRSQITRYPYYVSIQVSAWLNEWEAE